MEMNWSGSKREIMEQWGERQRERGREREIRAHLCVSASHRRTQTRGQSTEKGRKGEGCVCPPPPRVIFPQTQHAFYSFVWTHTFTSNCCFSFLVCPTRRTCIMQDKQRIWRGYYSETTLNSCAPGQRFLLHAGSGCGPGEPRCSECTSTRA